MEPKHVGTWVVAVTREQDLIKWGRGGDTVYPHGPDERNALQCVRHLMASPLHREDVFYLLRVFDNGQMLTVAVTEDILSPQKQS